MGAPVIVSFGWTGEDRKINVVERDGKWLTEHVVDGSPDEQLVRLFGTNVIPTPWSADKSRDEVVEELAVRNPNSSVS